MFKMNVLIDLSTSMTQIIVGYNKIDSGDSQLVKKLLKSY